MNHRHSYGLTHVPRRYAPAWVWSWMPNPLRSWVILLPPIKWALFRKVGAAPTETEGA